MKKDTETTDAPMAQEETPTLESQFALGLAALDAALGASVDYTLSYDVRRNSSFAHDGKWFVGIDRNFTGDRDMPLAIERALEKHREKTATKAGQIAKLRDEAAKLGVELVEGGQ